MEDDRAQDQPESSRILGARQRADRESNRRRQDQERGPLEQPVGHWRSRRARCPSQRTPLSGPPATDPHVTDDGQQEEAMFVGVARERADRSSTDELFELK